MCPPVFRELEGQTSGRACFRAVGWECPTPEGPLAHLLARPQAAVADPYTIEGEFGCGGMATRNLARDLKHEGYDMSRRGSPSLAHHARHPRPARNAARLCSHDASDMTVSISTEYLSLQELLAG